MPPVKMPDLTDFQIVNSSLKMSLKALDNIK